MRTGRLSLDRIHTLKESVVKTIQRGESPRRVYITLAVALSVMIGAMLGVSYMGKRLIARQAPLVDAAMEIKLELTTAHLWLEEALSGDQQATIEDVRRHLDEAAWYARAMLEGGRNAEGTFIPLDRPELRHSLRDVRSKIVQFHEITEQRWNARDSSGVDTHIDRRYDTLFEELMLLADAVETETQRAMAAETRMFFWLQGALVLGCMGLALFIGVVLHRYVAQRDRAERLQRELLAELEAKNAELEQFSYTVSHDLRSPLVTVKGFVGLLEKDLAAEKTHRAADHIKRIAGAADKMAGLLDDVLELSRIGRVVNPPEDVSLKEMTQDVTSLLAGHISDSGVRIDVSPDLPTLYGDATRLREVLQNLIENAIRYMGEQPDPRIAVNARIEDDHVVCSVADNGIGIEPEYQGKIFGLFDTLDSENEGTGVGLALVKRIVETHGGRIWVESEGSLKGTTFYFTLPKKETTRDQTGGERCVASH